MWRPGKFYVDLEGPSLRLYQTVGKHFLDHRATLWANELADARTSVIQLGHREAVLVGTVNESRADWLFFGLHVQKS